MSKVDTYACDMCKVQKKEVNHWFLGFIYTGMNKTNPCITLYPWCSEMLQEGAIHLCGIEHAMQWAGRELSKLCAVTECQ